MGITKASISDLNKGDIGIAGLAIDHNSSYLRGPAKAPGVLLTALESASANYYTESLNNLENHPRVKWLLDGHVDEYDNISSTIEEVLSKGAIPFSIGGDHSVTFPVLQSVGKKYRSLNILHFDAHGDLYDELDNNKLSHATPFARIMENGLAKRLVQVGIRTVTPHQKEQAEKFGVEQIEMKDLDVDHQFEFDGPVYLSFDLDVLDPAFAPGISHYEPGGMSTRQAIHMIQGLKLDIVGADIVELNPDRDINGMTAMAAAKIAKELIDKLL